MKRCPQCDFIYEDEQSLCDMDGVLLVLDSRVLPNMHALATVEVPAAPKAHWRHRTFPAMAALILATVFSLVYFVSTTRTAPSPAPISGASVAVPVAEPAPVAESSQPTADSNHAVVPAAEEVNSSTVTKEDEKKPDSTKAAMTPSKKKASAPTIQRKRAEEKKEENKVGSILKKTGRILKKPFKF
ncbi:MAG TPA: hypothetical protein VGW58_00060 [Pyrinomonadaceae bacterium]|nr:hypothetical protein [Pyrinomonadaceae bacterium]